jgi:hypothetical protein
VKPNTCNSKKELCLPALVRSRGVVRPVCGNAGQNMPAAWAGRGQNYNVPRPNACVNKGMMWGEFNVGDPSCGPGARRLLAA